jgi:hypothetical protein
MKRVVPWLVLAACAQQEPAQVPVVAAQPTASSAPAPEPPPPPPSPPPQKAQADPFASGREQIAATYADLDEVTMRTPRCQKADATAAKMMTDGANNLRAQADGYLSQLGALEEQAKAIAQAPQNDPSVPIRRRDLGMRVDELSDQIRRCRSRAALVVETARKCP